MNGRTRWPEPEAVNTAAKQDRLPVAEQVATAQAAPAEGGAGKPEFDASDDKPALEMDAPAETADARDVEVAAAGQAEQPAAARPDPPKPDVNLALDAVETEGTMVFAAGTGNPGSRVRVYVDNSLIGETVAPEQSHQPIA